MAAYELHRNYGERGLADRLHHHIEVLGRHGKDEKLEETLGDREVHRRRNLAKLSPDRIIKSHRKKLKNSSHRVCVDGLVEEETRRRVEVSWAIRWRLWVYGPISSSSPMP